MRTNKFKGCNKHEKAQWIHKKFEKASSKIICSLDALKNSSKNKETKIKKKRSMIYSKLSYRRKRTEN